MDKFDAILEAHVAQGDETVDKVLGAAFTVVNKDGIIYSGSAGRSRTDPSSRPFQQDTFTWIASATKVITTTCIMQIVEKGKIALDDDVRPLVPELAALQILRGFDGDKPILEDNTRPITLRILLTHTLGLPYDIGDPELVQWSKYVGRTDWAMTWNRNGFLTPVKFAPGDAWLYGPAVDWAGFVLEAITGDTLGAYMQSHIFDPLSMTDTGFWPERLSDDISERGVEPVERSQDTGKLEGRSPWPPAEHEIESGGAGLYSTAQDYAKFLRAFLNGELLSEQSMTEVFKPQLDEKQRAAMEELAYGDAYLGFVPGFPKGHPLNHGLAGVINSTDIEGKRRSGSITWSGMVNSRWWVDRKTGVAAILVAHLMPFGDPVIASLYDQLEKVVYEIVGDKAY